MRELGIPDEHRDDPAPEPIRPGRYRHWSNPPRSYRLKGTWTDPDDGHVWCVVRVHPLYGETEARYGEWELWDELTFRKAFTRIPDPPAPPEGATDG